MKSRNVLRKLLITGLLAFGLASCGQGDRTVSSDGTPNGSADYSGPEPYVDRINIELDESQYPNVDPSIPKGMKFEEDEIRHCSCLVMYDYIDKTSDGQINTVVKLKACLFSSSISCPITETELRFAVSEQYHGIATVTQKDNLYFSVSFKEEGPFNFDIYSTDGYGARTTVNFMCL